MFASTSMGQVPIANQDVVAGLLVVVGVNTAVKIVAVLVADATQL